MNEKEWLIEMIEEFISDTNDFIGNADEPELIPILESLTEKLAEYIVLIESGEVDNGKNKKQ